MNRMTCPGDELELIRLLDGELTENRAQDLREHLAGCAACTQRLRSLQALAGQLRAPATAASAADEAADHAFLEAVVRRLPAVPASPAVASDRTPARWRRTRVLTAMSLIGVAAAGVALWRLPRPPGDEFAVRGLPAPWHAPVTVDLGAATTRPGGAGTRMRPLTPGLRLTPDDAIVVSARNHSRSPVYLMVFAVDASRTVHWIQPLWSNPADNPGSVALPPGGPRLTEAVAPEAPAPGPLRVMTLLSRTPLDVRTVENLLQSNRPLTNAGDERHLTSLELQMAR